MKPVLYSLLAVLVCFPAIASETAGVPAVSPEVVLQDTSKVPPAASETNTEAVSTLPTSSVPNFCGQTKVYGLMMKTEFGQQLQLRQQQALQNAVAEVADKAPVPGGISK